MPFSRCALFILVALGVVSCSPEADPVLRRIEQLGIEASVSDQDLVYLLETAGAEGNSVRGSMARGALMGKASIQLCYRILGLRPSLKMSDRCFSQELLNVVNSMHANQGINEFSTPRIIADSLIVDSVDQGKILEAWKEWLAELSKRDGP